MNLTSERLLRVMDRGREYPPSELSARFGTSTALVKDMLCTLVEDGFVRMVSHSSRIIRFVRLPAPTQSTSIPPVSTTATTNAEPSGPPGVATMPVTRQLTGSLAGYEATLASVRNLAMLTR